MQRHGSDRGQVLPFVAVLVLVAGLLGVGVAHLGVVVVDHARAQAAADAAALTGVVDGRATAERLARADGAVVVSFERVGTDVLVTVELAHARASARARAVRVQTPGARAGPAVPGCLVCSSGGAR